MSQYNRNTSVDVRNNLMIAIKKLNEALTAYDRSLCGINTSVKNFHYLAKDCQKYKL